MLNLLKNICVKKYPKLKEYITKDSIIRLAINYEYTSMNNKLSRNDEVALFPPVSGG